jgi:hypothetical protein
MSDSGRDIHRTSEETRLHSAIAGAPDGLSIVSVSGPGGIGKSFLVEHVLDALSSSDRAFFTLRGDASNPDTRGDFFGILEGQVFSRSLPPPADSTKDYFPSFRRIADLHRALVEGAKAEIASKGAPIALQQAASVLLRTGRVLNGAVPMTRAALVDASGIDGAEVEQAIDDAWGLVRTLRPMRDSTLLAGKMRDLVGITKRSRVKRDLFAITSEELRADLTKILTGPDATEKKQLKFPRIAGKSKLLLVLDDFEAISALLGEFLVGGLIPTLAAAPFTTVLLVVGREDLEASHPAWAQHAKRYLRDAIKLGPLDREAAFAMLADAGVAEVRRGEIFEATGGSPFLLSLAVEQGGAEVDSVAFLRRYCDRVTRWMGDREHEWLSKIIYLDRIDEDSIAAVLPGENAKRVQDWFEREPSLRDPDSSYFRVRPQVREKLIRYFELRTPKRAAEMRDVTSRLGMRAAS